jgi:hypothetical protein
MKRLDLLAGKVYLIVSYDIFSIPNSYQIAKHGKSCGYSRVWLSLMHCETWPLILWLYIKKAKSMLLFKRTTPRTVRQPICDEVGCLHPRATRLALYISRVKGR